MRTLGDWRRSCYGLQNMLAERHNITINLQQQLPDGCSADGSAWRMWAELEAELGDAERAALFNKHAAVVETEELMLDAISGGPANPLDPRNMYRE